MCGEILHCNTYWYIHYIYIIYIICSHVIKNTISFSVTLQLGGCSANISAMSRRMKDLQKLKSCMAK